MKADFVMKSSAGIAENIRTARIRAGKSRAEAAAHLALNPAWYGDLEQRDGELAATLTLLQGVALAELFGLRLADLFGETVPAGERIALPDLPGRIRVHVAATGISLDVLEQQLGWELGPFLEAPVQLATELPIAFFQALADVLGLHWLLLVPDDAAAQR
jgi:transcriptional regulator with XRE-family HTH domain